MFGNGVLIRIFSFLSNIFLHLGLENHFHQHFNHMKGNVCVVGDKTKLAAPALNDQMLNQW